MVVSSKTDLRFPESGLFIQQRSSLYQMQDYVLARLELEECDELCHCNWIEIKSLQRQADFLKKLLEKTALYYQTITMTYDLFSCISN